MKIGDRVEYVGKNRPEWHGIPATLIEKGAVYASVKFDREWVQPRSGGASGQHGRVIVLSDLRPLNVIDPDKPLFADGSLAKGRTFEVVGTINFKADGRDLLMVKPTDCNGEVLHLDPRTGHVVPKHPADRVGIALVFRNGPIVEVKDVTVADLTVRVTRTDGAITAVEWVK